MLNKKDRFLGCLLGGAIGDALGYPVEFMDINAIHRHYGPNGITDLVCDEATGKAIVSDDTQMTIFTAEGILWADTRGRNRGICSYSSCVFYSYQRWLYTQTGKVASKDYEWILNDETGPEYKSNLLQVGELFHRRAPGNTCLSALTAATKQNYGTIEQHINNSKGCGGVMRVAPVGLYFHKTPEQAFHVACECAAITHGHPSGYLSAGVLAFIIAETVNDVDLQSAALAAIKALRTYDGHGECLNILNKAIHLAEQNIDPYEAVTQLGQGWVGEEALAISLYCALKYPNDFHAALCLAVNHSGDSDSTGAICGNILGAYLGTEGIPEHWLTTVELSEVISSLSDALLKVT
ncbi:MAG: ADP-ribosylglycohydrolase family protein [Thermoclostridium sp.]|nr:ADP-ribosylglycohydrolase family protein [Thermoclostridium sp.]